MTFREAEYDIKMNYDNSEDIILCLREMLKLNTTFLFQWGIDIRGLATYYYNHIQECRIRHSPVIEMTDKEIRQMRALLTCGLPITEISKRLGHSRHVLYKFIRGE